MTDVSDREEAAPKRGKQGFASMDPARQRKIAQKGGFSVPDDKRMFARDRELAARAGREGGRKSRPRPKEDAEPELL